MISEWGVEMVQTTIRVPELLYEKLKKIAKNRGMSLNALVLGSLWDLTEREKAY